MVGALVLSMETPLTWRLWPWILPSVLLGYVWITALLVLGMAQNPRYIRGVPAVTWRPWVAKRWRFSTTIGHGYAMSPRASQRTYYHEHLHVLQYEDLCLLGAALSASLLPWLGWQGSLILWATSGAPWLLPGSFLGSILRFKRRGISWMEAAYRLTEHERSAYAQTEADFR
jgi:hypothetical protein